MASAREARGGERQRAPSLTSALAQGYAHEVAVIMCPDCQAEVSDLVPACPKCGRPVREAPPVGVSLLVWASVIAMALMAIVWFAPWRYHG